ncbi:Uncharacterised protein [Mycobacterium tuberculosis]|nr:Uncharacterised protein [Mycobacterium tuberculosis]
MALPFFLLKLFSKQKNRKKRKSFNQGGQAEKPKGNGISPEGWQGNTKYSVKPLFLPCHYAVSFWLGGAVAVRLTFATFLFFLRMVLFPLYKFHRIVRFDLPFRYLFKFGFH